MKRRRFLLATGLGLAGVARRVSAQFDGTAIRYTRLAEPVRIRAEEVTTLWHAVPFTAEGMAPLTPAAAAHRVLISGVLFRRSGDGEPVSPEQLSAVCVTCPHEQCQVDLVTDAERLTRMTNGSATHPLFECGCHLSVFDALADGARISGETPRGLYRFRIERITQGIVEISEVESVALMAV
jgi:Rieske Fe-S protein